MIFVLFFACAPAFIFLPLRTEGEGPLILLTLLPFVFVGLGISIYLMAHRYSRARLGQPELLISSETLRLGESFTVNLMHTFKQNVTVDHIKLQFLFRETATYKQGTNTRTVIHNEMIEAFEMPGGPYRAGQMVQQSFTWQIPADGMHTVNVMRNKIQWFVRLDVGIPKLPDYIDEHELIVLPEKVKETSVF